VTIPRDIPSIEQLRQRASLRDLESRYGREAIVRALRAEADSMRRQLAEGATPPDIGAAIEAAVPARLESDSAPSLVAVINATGVVIHTNLGRAPLSDAAIARIAALAGGYTNLEYDLARGARGHRDQHAQRLLCRVTGADAAVVVNNNAAATLVVLAALATGREVLISRGELVEIGGGFRVPDVMAQSGARLREVGTTNRTRLSDYAAALSDKTAVILRVHPSNFRIEGFTERVKLDELVGLGRRFNVPVVEDLGSGYLGFAPGDAALGDEPDVRSSVSIGADLVLFSGDKLLGGPQSGIIVGKSDPVTAVRRHPLMRAMRVDKMTCAALEATLGEIAAGRTTQTIPVAAMISLSVDTIARRASALAERLASSGIRSEVVEGQSTIGGGSAPGSALATRLIALDNSTVSASATEAALRRGVPPVITRIEQDRVVIDLRTVPPAQDDVLAMLIATAVSMAI
jgi:L-seryl-tRNA(Ser) seleniumtransferase